MTSFLITFPVSLAGEYLDMKPDYRRNLDMTCAIFVTAGLVYLLGAGLGKLTRMALAAGGLA
jgi:hypothetical protein